MAGHDYYSNDKTGVGPAVRSIFNSNEFELNRTVWIVEKIKINRELFS